MINSIRTLLFATIGFLFPIVTIVSLGLLFPGSEQYQRHGEDEVNALLKILFYGAGSAFALLWAYAGYQIKHSWKRCLNVILGIFVGTLVGLFLAALAYRVLGTPTSQSTVSVISLSLWFLSSCTFSYVFVKKNLSKSSVV